MEDQRNILLNLEQLKRVIGEAMGKASYDPAGGNAGAFWAHIDRYLEAAKPPEGDLIEAARNADWMQVALNHVYGAPCFHFEAERGRFCLRARKWFGHDGNPHDYVSLADLLARVAGRSL